MFFQKCQRTWFGFKSSVNRAFRQKDKCAQKLSAFICPLPSLLSLLVMGNQSFHGFEDEPWGLCPRLDCVNNCWQNSKNLRWQRDSRECSETLLICQINTHKHTVQPYTFFWHRSHYCVLCKCGLNNAWLCSIRGFVTCGTARRPGRASPILCGLPKC